MKPGLVLVPIVALLGCQWLGGPRGDSPDGEVVARIGGQVVTRAETDAWLREELWHQQVEHKNPWELYEMRVGAVQAMARDRALREAAAERGVSTEQYLADEVAARPVTDSEIAEVFEENRHRFRPGTTLDEYRDTIREFLESRREETVLAELGESLDVEIALEMPRVSVDPVGPARGPAGAPVTIIEFSDYQCPFCRRTEPVIERILSHYGDSVRLVMRHYPLDSLHPRARAAAHAAVCAERGGHFWPFHRALFGSGLTDAELEAEASAVGLELEAFRSCLADPATDEVVERDVSAAREIGISGTPAFLVNGRLVAGALPFEAFANVIDEELARSKPPEAARSEAEPSEETR